MKIRLANNSDLPELKIMFKEIVEEMNNNGIKIWSDYYPYEMFKDDIKNKQLYVLVEDKKICATIGTFDNISGQECFEWADSTAKAMYIGRIGVNTRFLRRGIGSKAIAEAIKISKKKGCKYIRLTVTKENTPAIKLYEKNGFVRVKGEFHEYAESLNKTHIEYGYELFID